jgi:hypothetical protein
MHTIDPLGSDLNDGVGKSHQSIGSLGQGSDLKELKKSLMKKNYIRKILQSNYKASSISISPMRM